MKTAYKKSRRHVKNGKLRSATRRASSSSSWGNGSMEQVDLLPGSLAQRDYDADKNKSIVQTTNNIDNREPEGEKAYDDESIDSSSESLEFARKKEELRSAYLIANSNKHITNLRRRKRSKANKVKAIIEGGLGKSVSKYDLDDEIFDNGVMAEEMEKEAIRDHKREFEDICEPKKDLNGDGKIDDDDVIMTPGMRRMSRYL